MKAVVLCILAVTVSAVLLKQTPSCVSDTECTTCAGTSGCAWTGEKLCVSLKAIQNDLIVRASRPEECDDMIDVSSKEFKNPLGTSPGGCNGGINDCDYLITDGKAASSIEHASSFLQTDEHASTEHASTESAAYFLQINQHASSEHASTESAASFLHIDEHASSEHASTESAASFLHIDEHASSEHASTESAASFLHIDEHASSEHASTESAASFLHTDEHASSEHASTESAASFLQTDEYETVKVSNSYDNLKLTESDDSVALKDAESVLQLASKSLSALDESLSSMNVAKFVEAN